MKDRILQRPTTTTCASYGSMFCCVAVSRASSFQRRQQHRAPACRDVETVSVSPTGACMEQIPPVGGRLVPCRAALASGHHSCSAHGARDGGVSCARARRTRCVGSGPGYFGVASHQPATDSGSWVRRGPDVRGVAARHGTRRVRGKKKGWRGEKHGCVGTMPFELVMIRWSTGWTRPIRPRLGQCRRAGAGAGVGTDVVVRGRAGPRWSLAAVSRVCCERKESSIGSFGRRNVTR